MQSASGIDLNTLLQDEYATIIFSYGFMTHLDRAMSENQNFIKNTTFGASF
jgi:hypothetical protein